MLREIPKGKYCGECPFSGYECDNCPEEDRESYYDYVCGLFERVDCFNNEKCEECLDKFGVDGASIKIIIIRRGR